jgi:tetratricopeptide (TPR) repeat protein
MSGASQAGPPPMTGARPSADCTRGTLLATLMLIGITAVAYGPVLGHHFIESWDDSAAILGNPDYDPPTFRKLAHYWVPPPKSIFYVPVTYTLWGLLAMASRPSAPPGLPFNPAIFYAANLFSHAVSAGLVFLILTRLLPRTREDGGDACAGAARAHSRVPLHGEREGDRGWFILAAWLGAAVFAMHPVQVEGVATASSLYTPLSGMFGFFGVWQYLLFSERESGKGELRDLASKHYALAILGFVLAVLTKPTAVAVPLIIAVIELTLRKRKLLGLAVTLGPWIFLSLLAIWLNQQSSPGATVFVPERLFRPLVPLDAIGFYVTKVFAPIRLASDYGRSPRWLIVHPLAWLTCLIPLLIGGLAWHMRRRVPWLLASFGVFVAGLLPSIGIVPFDFQHYSTVADRYMYLAMLGPAMAVAFLVARFRRLAAGVAMAVVGILATLSVIQLSYWHDDWHLMAHTLEVNPQSVSAINGLRYLLTGWHDTRAFPAPRSCTLDQRELARVGDLLMHRRLWPLAAAAYHRALSRGEPTAMLYDRLGDALLRDTDPKSAAEAYKEALRLDPKDQTALHGLSQAAALFVSPATVPFSTTTRAMLCQ